MAVITIENLKYRYPGSDNLVLNGVNLSIEKGEFIGIVGANKSGKSSLCQAMIGLVPQFYKGAYGGSVIIHPEKGEDINVAKSPVSANSSTIGLIFQNPFNQLSGAKETVFDEVAFGLQNLGIERDEMNARIERVLKQLDIWQYRDRNPFELSGGQMQRVAISGVLVMEPEIIVLDEPTSQLDPQGTEEVFKAIKQLSGMGITVVMVEQKMEKIAEYCNRVVLMHEGRVIDFDSPDRIFSRDDIYSYGVEPPVYTRFCKENNITDSNGLYPSDLSRLLEIIDKNNLQINVSEQVLSGKDKISRNVREVFRVENLEFSYDGKVKIFDKINVSFDLRPTAIIGQNGAGKTTLVRLLKGLLKPNGGDIFLENESILNKTVASLSSRVGYVFQNPDDQIFKNSVIDEIMFGPLNIGMSVDEAREHAIAAMEMMGLTGLENDNPYDLDLYERKMVAIASVIAMDTRVIILDEPTIAQDYDGKGRIADMIRKLSEEGKLVIAILHDMDFVAKCFERVIVMAKGGVLADATAEEVFAMDEVLDRARLYKPYMLMLKDKLDLM